MSMSVTMRPRKLSTPATSGGASGTRVRRSGMKTSCTRRIGKPKSWPPIMAVTYSFRLRSAFSVLMVLASRRTTDIGLLLERHDQSLPVEFGDIVMKADPSAALDRVGRHHRGQCNDRQVDGARVAAHGLGEFEAVHVWHLDIGDGHVERGAVLEHRQSFLRGACDGDFVTSGLQ